MIEFIASNQLGFILLFSALLVATIVFGLFATQPAVNAKTRKSRGSSSGYGYDNNDCGSSYDCCDD